MGRLGMETVKTNVDGTRIISTSGYALLKGFENHLGDSIS